MKNVKTLTVTIIAAFLLAMVAANSGLAMELKVGDRGNDVKKIQGRLTELGYDVGLVDGIYGNRTRGEVRKYQSDNGLPVTGIVDDKTWRILFSEESKPKTEPEEDEFEIEDESYDEDFEDFDSWDMGESSVSLEFGGHLKSAFAAKFMESDDRFPNYIVWNNVLYYQASDPTKRISLQENRASFYLKGDYQGSISSNIVADVVHHSNPDRPFEDKLGVEIDEAYIRYSGETIGLTVGKEKVVWGIIDIISPFNVLNSGDLVDPFVNTGLDDTQGQWMVHFNLDMVDKFRLEAIFVPIWTRSIVPMAETKENGDIDADYWLPPVFTSIPSLVYIQNGAIVYDEWNNQTYVDMVMVNEYTGLKKPKKDLSSASFGGRLLLSLGDYDLGAYFISCKDPKPNPIIDLKAALGQIDLGELGQPTALVMYSQVRQEFSRTFVWGESIETVKGKFRLKQETGMTYGHKFFPDITTPEGWQKLYSKVYESQANYAAFKEEGDKYLALHSIFGAEYTIPGADIITSAQVGWTHRFGYEEGYFGRADNINLTLYAQKSFADDQFTSSVASMIETSSGAAYISPRLKFVPNYFDFLEFNTGANLFLGEREEEEGIFVSYNSILGSYKKYSHFFVTGKLLFDIPLVQ